MHEKQEISDSIDSLFQLDEKAFDSNIHFGIADTIVAALGSQSHILGLYDIWEGSFKGRKYEAERGRVGQYVVKHIGKLPRAAVLGWRPKIEIVHWKDRFFDRADRESLVIAYQENQAKVITKDVNQAYSLTIPLGYLSFTLTYNEPKSLWLFER